jgi:hypothetical protein
VKKPLKSKSRRSQFETLERRDVMTGVTAALSSTGVLNVTGTASADQINFRQSSNVISISGVNGSWTAAQVKAIVVDVRGGNDTVSLNSLANGGNQALAEYFTIKSGRGSDQVRLADGHTASFSGLGHTVTVAASGVASLDGRVLSWNTPTPTPPATNWFDTHVTDAALRSLGHSLYTDGLINRSDMIALLRNADDGSVIDATELTDLRAIVANTSLFGTLSYVDQLAADVVNGSVANAKYLGQSLGNLTAGAASTKMDNLVNKWFLGLDHPVASGDPYLVYSSYRQFSGSLFVNGATYTDVKQGYLGDCYFMLTLGEVALHNPNTITNMFIVNGDGTYTLKFFNNGQANYVTVDNYLPTDSAGRLIYAGLGMAYNNTGNELWTALAEKGFVQLNELGWERPMLSGSGQNSYQAISGGYVYAALGQVTSQSTVAFAMTGSTQNYNFNTFVTAFNAGKMIGFASKSAPAAGSGVVGGHAYGVVSYNAANQTVTFFNPWGTQYPQLTLTWAQIQQNFDYFDRTA